MQPAREILLLLVSATAVAAFARSPVAPAEGAASAGVFSTFLVPIATLSDLLMGPLAGIVKSLPVVGPILAPNGSILGFNFGGIIMSTSKALDNALAPILGGIGGIAGGPSGGPGPIGPSAATTTPSTATST